MSNVDVTYAYLDRRVGLVHAAIEAADKARQAGDAHKAEQWLRDAEADLELLNARLDLEADELGPWMASIFTDQFPRFLTQIATERLWSAEVK